MAAAAAAAGKSPGSGDFRRLVERRYAEKQPLASPALGPLKSLIQYVLQTVKIIHNKFLLLV